MDRLGDAFDFAIREAGIPGDDFARLFVQSMICRKLENGEPRYLIGKSGIELAAEVLEETAGWVAIPEPRECYDRSPEYWCGWAACYYQWLTAVPYREVFRIACYDEIRGMYEVLHEADVRRFADAMEQRRRLQIWETNLRRIRRSGGYSQSELARASGVSLRSIQMYEQRNKDINKAQGMTILQLARTLGCRMEDLLEP